MAQFDKFEEYKFLIEDTAKMTDRRQNISNLYTTVNSILLAAIAVLFTETSLNAWSNTLGGILVSCAGIAISLSWKNSIVQYQKLLRLRFDVLWEIEEDPELASSAKIYHRESDELYPRDEKQQKFREKGLFAQVEKQLPMIFIGLYAVLGLGIVIFSLT